MPIFEKTGTIKVGSYVNADKTSANAIRWNSLEKIRDFKAKSAIGGLRVGSSEIVILASEAPYSDKHHMIAVLDDPLVANHQDWTSALFIYDLSPEVQEAYWAVALHSIKELSGANSQNPAVFMQNVFKTVANHEPGKSIRTGRSTFYPHGHVVSFDMEGVEAGEPEVGNLNEERILFKQLAPLFIQSFEDAIAESDLRTLLEISAVVDQADDYPHGYEISLDDPISDISKFSLLLSAHHETYNQAMQKVWKSFNRSFWQKYWKENHPFPAYRDYLYYDSEGRLNYRVCPVLLCPEGVLEAGKIRLVRSHEIETGFASFAEFRQSLVEGAGRVIATAESILK